MRNRINLHGIRQAAAWLFLATLAEPAAAQRILDLPMRSAAGADALAKGAKRIVAAAGGGRDGLRDRVEDGNHARGMALVPEQPRLADRRRGGALLQRFALAPGFDHVQQALEVRVAQALQRGGHRFTYAPALVRGKGSQAFDRVVVALCSQTAEALRGATDDEAVRRVLEAVLSLRAYSTEPQRA